MAKVSPLQSNFSAGEFSPLAQGRVEADRYKTGVDTCLNYYPTAQGGLTRRGGSVFVGETKFSSKKSRLIPFEVSATTAYVLEFGDEYARIYKDYGVVTFSDKTITAATAANPVVITSAAHSFSNGDRVVISGIVGMVELNNREFIVANVAANTFELKTVDSVNVNGTGYTAYVSGGVAAKIVEITSSSTPPYQDTDVNLIKYTQSNDVLYLAHPSYKPYKVSRSSDTAWTITALANFDGPYLGINPTLNDAFPTTLTPSAATGTGVTLTASQITGINSNQGFKSTDVGRIIRIKEGSTWGFVTITGFTSTTVVTVTVNSTLTNTSSKSIWAMGAWSDTTGWPTAVTFHEDRLVFVGPQQGVYASRTGDYENFRTSDADGTTTESHALSFNLNSNQNNVCKWITSDEKGMLIGTNGSEWVVTTASPVSPKTETNVKFKEISTFGSADVQPVKMATATLFLQKASRKMRELTYFYETEGFRAVDVSLLSEHITAPALTYLAHQKEPLSLMWGIRSDGQLVTMAYERDPDSLRVGWSRHIMGGVSDAAGSDAIAESVAIIPSPDISRNDPWIIVKRYINGRTVRSVEYISKIFELGDDQRDAFFVDCGLTYDSPLTITTATAANPVVITSNSHGLSNGDEVRITEIVGMTEINDRVFTVANKTANTFELSGENGTSYNAYVSGGEARKLVTTISGLFHLEGQTVDVLADGATHPQVTISGGKFTLDVAAATVHAGYSYNSDIKLLRFEAGAADGTAQGKTRRMHQVGIQVYQTLGMKLGVDSFDDLDTITFRTSADLMDSPPALFTGILHENLGADYNFDNQLCLRQDQPLPSTILAIMPQMVTQDRG